MSDLDLSDNPGLIRAVADAINRNECRMYEPGLGHSADKCPAAIAAVAVAVAAAAPLIAAQVRAQVAAEIEAEIEATALHPTAGDDFSRGFRGATARAARIARGDS